MTRQQTTDQDIVKIVRALEPLDEWLKYIDPDGPRPASLKGSSLIGDDAATQPYHISHAAWRGLSISIDHLYTARLTIAAGVLPTYSGFTVLRAAMENAATAVWLLSPSNRNERILRRLRLANTDMIQFDRLATLMNSVQPRTLQQRQSDLKQIAAARNIPDAFIKKGLGYEEIVETAGAATPMTAIVCKVVWKSCSAVAHGDMSTLLGMIEHEQIGLDGNIVRSSASAPVNTLALMTALTVGMTRKAISLYEGRRKPRY